MNKIADREGRSRSLDEHSSQASAEAQTGAAAHTCARRGARIQEQRTLTDAESEELVGLYLAGANATGLATRFGVHRTTVASHVRRAGHRMRGQT